MRWHEQQVLTLRRWWGQFQSTESHSSYFLSPFRAKSSIKLDVSKATVVFFFPIFSDIRSDFESWNSKSYNNRQVFLV
jgi:hypothetical protein